MERFSRYLVVLAICQGGFGVAVSAGEIPSAPEFPLPDILTEVTQQVKFVEQIGKGDVEAAYHAIEGQLSQQLQQAHGPFETGSLESFKNEFGRIADHKSQFESVECVGYIPISSAARHVVLIANGKHGPILFRFQMRRYEGKWQLIGLGFETDWKRIEAADNCKRFEQPAIFELPSEQQAAADERVNS